MTIPPYQYNTISLTAERGLEGVLLPAITFYMTEIKPKKPVWILAKTKYYGGSLLVKRFYKPIMLL